MPCPCCCLIKPTCTSKLQQLLVQLLAVSNIKVHTARIQKLLTMQRGLVAEYCGLHLALCCCECQAACLETVQLHSVCAIATALPAWKQVKTMRHCSQRQLQYMTDGLPGHITLWHRRLLCALPGLVDVVCPTCAGVVTLSLVSAARLWRIHHHCFIACRIDRCHGRILMSVMIGAPAS